MQCVERKIKSTRMRWTATLVSCLLVFAASPLTRRTAMGQSPSQAAPASEAVFGLQSPASDPGTSKDEQLISKGREIYRSVCADCHGKSGEGVESLYDAALTGDLSVGQLAKVVSDTMPEGEPDVCAGADAAAVAAFMHREFYSEAAQIRNRPPKEMLARLTGSQLRQSIADLYEHYTGKPSPSAERGVRGFYFAGDRWKEESKKIERIDPVLNFDWGRYSPGEGIESDSFYIYWEGGLLAPETGRYEIVVRSTCSFIMHFGSLDREFIDNHVQSGDKTEFRQVVTLTAGRIYPFKFDFRQRDRKTENPPASISLSWRPPHGVEEIIPQRFLIASGARPTFSLETQLPPDDRSYGFERGIAVNRQWDNSTTTAALEFAEIANNELWPLYQKRHRKDPNENREQLRSFLSELVGVAFRRALDEPTRLIYVDQQLAKEPDDSEAIKRVLLLALKSPRFLYPTLGLGESESQRRGNRLALILRDSLPAGDEIVKAIAANRLETDEQARKLAARMVGEFPTRAKMQAMLHEWLNLAHINEITKDNEKFPGFTPELASDLRTSLDMFLEEVVWGDSGDYRQFFNAKSAFTNFRIADFYGDKWLPTAGLEMRKTETPAEDRFGLLTHPFLLSGLAYHDSTSPIHRGVFLIRYMLGRTLRPPQEAFSPLSPDLHPDLTTRERVELQTSPDSCQVCHTRINGLGFALENYDAVGRFRDKERDRRIESDGHYIARDGEKVIFSGVEELANYLANSDDAHQAFVSRLFQHFVKQPPAAYGPETLSRLTKQFQEDGFNIPNLIVEVAVTASRVPPNDQQTVAAN